MRPPKLETLKSLDREPLLDFLVRFKRARAKDPSMDVSEWLRGQVIYNIRSHGINVDNTEAVLQHLDNIEKLQAESRIKHSISWLRKELQWPSEAQSGLEAIRIFILRAREILGPDRNLSKGAQKGVIKTLVKILPQYFPWISGEAREQDTFTNNKGRRDHFESVDGKETPELSHSSSNLTPTQEEETEHDSPDTPSEERYNIEKGARTLQLPSDKPVILTGIDIELTSDQLPETKYFRGDGPNLEKEVERRKIIKIFKEKLNNTEFLTKNEKAKILRVVTANIDAFGLLQGTGQMSALSPVHMHLIPGAPPGLNVKPSPVGEIEEKWLKMRLIELEDTGIIKRSMDPVFSAPIHVVPKKSDDERKKFRLVVDMRQINDLTIRTALQLPHLEQQLQRSREARYYGAPDLMRYVEPDAIKKGLMQWVDDVLLYAIEVEEYLEMLDEVLKAFIKKKVRLNATKCELIAKEIKYCGRIISGGTYHFNKEYYKTILTMTQPILQYQMASVLYVCNWLAPTEDKLSEKGWHISQKEMYPILKIMCKMDFMLKGHPERVRVYTDHKNLIFLARLRWAANKTQMTRLGRWAFRIQDSNLCFFHIKGEENIMADMISRWDNPDAAIEESKIVLAELHDDAEDANEEDNPTLKELMRRMDE
eukprot:augustus_masked-scaffold_7-processed-gene-0.45-mRNA-1 protein AED:1.00 eAED:1.00 QI:0/0/0/0/1/1/6/0/651